jgi:hypothetical protein
VASILHGFRSPKNIGRPRPQRPSYRPAQRPSHHVNIPRPSFKLPFIGGFGKSKSKKRQPTGRPSYNRPSSEYGAPQGPFLTSKPTYNSNPSYNNNNNRPPRKTTQNFFGFLGDPRADEREDVDDDFEPLVFTCGESAISAETFSREFVFRSPGYPNNYPDSVNCSVNIFPRKDVCALGLELVN